MMTTIDAGFVRKHVDAHVDDLPATQSDLQVLYEHFGMPQNGSYGIYEITRELAKRASECFRSGHAQARMLIARIQDDLIYDYVLEQKPIDPYFAVLDHLKDALLQGARTALATGNPTIDGDWAGALDCARDSTLVHDWTAHGLRERAHERTFQVAWAARRLRNLDVKLARASNAVGLDDTSDRKVANIIDNAIRQLGGLNVARRVFQHIATLYHPVQERYHLVRRVAMTGGGVPQIPFGYLMLLAEKHAHSRSHYAISDQEWQSLCQLAGDYAALLNVQPYTPNFSIHIDPNLLPRVLQEMAVYDSLFALSQLRGSDLVDLIYGTLDGLDLDRKFGGLWSINEVVRVIAALLDLSKDTRGPVVFDRRRLQRLYPAIDHKTLRSILDDVLSHAPGEVNKGYCQPLDVQSATDRRSVVTFPLRPLIKSDGRRYFWMDRSLCAPNCLETLFTPLRAAIANFDTDQVGPAIERFLERKFRAAGIVCRSGNYAVGRQVRECDLVIEAEDAIIFIEIKKKPLTFRARFGSDLDLLIDLADSVVRALTQSGWHEYELRKHGYLDLVKGSQSYRLEQRGRHVERIAVSLLDFGGFQDRVFIDGFLSGLRSAKFHPVDPVHKPKFDKFNASIAGLNTQISLLNELGVDMTRPFFHCWFLSVPQLLVILDGVLNADEFKKSLWRPRHFSSGASDFYYEYAYLTPLNAATANTTAKT